MEHSSFENRSAFAPFPSVAEVACPQAAFPPFFEISVSLILVGCSKGVAPIH
jgi:hypothetical protein